MNDITTAFLGMLQALRTAHYKNGAPKARGNEYTIRKKSGKTRRGAKHVINPTFLSKKVFSVSPAEYRRKHMGVTHVRSDSHK